MPTKKPRRPAADYRPAPHVAWRRVDEESVLLNVDTSEYYSLDPVATEIWERLGKGEPVDRIARAIAQGYRVPAGRAERDTREFIGCLLREELLLQADAA